MKKILLCLSGFVIIGFIVIIVLSVRKNVNEKVVVYTIPTSYCYKYKEDRKMSFEIYINDDNSIISLPEENTYNLVAGSSYFLLNNVTVDINYNTDYENESYYKYTINCDILNYKNLIIKYSYLEIINRSFTLLVKLGSLRIVTNEYEELSFSELYGNYTYINNELYLIGITITLNSQYNKIYSLSVGEGFGNLDYIEKDTYKDAEIDFSNLNHKIIDSKKIYDGVSLEGEYNTYFIPISYLSYCLITNSPVFINIDHKSYYIDNYQFLITNMGFDSYESILNKGEVKYA